ncbi:SDR family oxidoreductase [Jeotgalibacillus marinus]|uniref:SDR family oxidoreductase n=1 Tax=Jeotgalibacillus marinus TaxID=86667 RepID=A0ABV3Q405_9BACL
MTSLFDLSGKTALITGGGSGLGKLMAEVYAEHGANIAVCSRKYDVCLETAQEITQKYGVKTAAFSCNVSDEEDVKRTIKEVIDTFDKIDILVNNSGATWGEKVEDMPLEAWNKVINVNTTGTFLMCREAGRHMLKQNSGKIINIGSVAGLKAEPKEVLNAIGYSTSKAAIHHFTKDLARKWAGNNITINAIAPGFFETKMTKHTLEVKGDAIKSSHPMGKIGDEQSLKGTALLLASRASDYITGQIIAVDGGSSL